MASAPRSQVPPRHPPEAHKGRGMKSISDTASKADKAGRPALLSFDEMPEWFRLESNQWILHGYRPMSGSAHASFCSWSYIYNESVNIHSHLIPAIFFLLGEWYIQQYLASRYYGVTGADFIAFSIFMLTAVTCLSLSATYHTLMNHSQHVEHFCLRLDMLGVVIFILGDLILGIYIIFWCEPLPRNIWYLSLTLFFPRLIDWSFRVVDHLHDNASQVPGLKVSRLPSIDVRGDWLVRCCALDPWIQCVRHVADDEKSFFPYTLAKAGCLLSGTSFYAVSLPISHTREKLNLTHVVLKTRFPESQYPGKSDPIRSFTSWWYAPLWSSS
ncbi:hemolysin-III family protein [Phialemonium atrogriseum]|uniref:Hemolysin-III family protein n=1 Tax=Phialemonium atrogriseum TaxID=1093897 RepID=A0AAJ0C608_9PEZI|nr:hemolysin-III family protein [Phialemonium atrogriseum]KAK1769638.1 hemolysin-III family protein [Phialemonium atrogriseum]